jgi:hypothetical protein
MGETATVRVMSPEEIAARAGGQTQHLAHLACGLLAHHARADHGR